MSKRHQSSRRRSSGRRQHELHERQSYRRHQPVDDDADLDAFGTSSQQDPLSFQDPRAPRLRFALGE